MAIDNNSKEEKDLTRLREIQRGRTVSIAQDNTRKRPQKLSISATNNEWKRLRHSKKLLKIYGYTMSEYISCVLLKLDEDKIEELIKLRILEDKERLSKND